MSEITYSFKKHKRQPNMICQNRMSIEKGKNLGPYEILDLIKEGSSSKIYLGKSKFTKELVAIKAINKSPLKNNLDDLLLITKQMETLKILKHRNIVTLYEIYESKKYIFLITEYLGGKDLIEKLIHKKRFNEEETLRIFFQLLDALIYMHQMNICHRNLRAEHILFDKNNRPKIVGFGYSSFYESNKTIEGAYGSLCYACPEIIDETPYNPELADVWSLGVILYVLICGYLPFSDEDDNKNKILISSGKIDFPKEISNKLKDLLRHMLDQNPNKRYTFDKVLKHPWIKPYSEKILSQGINIYKIKFPVDERILNIINEYGLDKNNVKNDLIMNKYNVGTGIYKQIVRKLLDIKIKNISDLWSEEFVAYRDDKNNKYEDGEKRYEEFIEKIDEKYRKKEDFVNDFKEREENIAEKLVYLKDKKEEKEKNKDKLKTIEEAVVDDGGEEIGKEINNKSDNENEKKDKGDNENNIRTIKTQQKNNNKKNKLFPRTKTPMFNFGELMKARRANNANTNTNNSTNNNILNNENVQIIYNKDQDVDIIQQFQEEQNKKLSENIIMENPTHKKVPSTPNFGKGGDNREIMVSETNPFKLSITPEKNNDLANKILNQNQIRYTGKNTNENTNSINSNNYKNSLYSNINAKNSLFSNINNKNDNHENIFKNLVSGNTLYTFNSNSNNNAKSLFRMTVVRKSSNKSYLSRGSLYDDFLKKNHPDNIRKTIMNSKTKLYNISNRVNINEGIKEKDESESDNENENNEEKEKEKKELDKELKKSLKLKFSLSFDDDDEDEEENEGDNSIENKDDDEKLFKMLENENDEELKELKNIYFSKDSTDKDKQEEKKPIKSVLKKKNVKFNDDNQEKSPTKSPETNLKKSIVSKLTVNSSNNNNLGGSILEGLDKYEEKLKEINKNYQITNDREEDGNSNIRFDSQLEISFHDDIDEKFRVNYYNNYTDYNTDKDPIKKVNINKDVGLNIDDIYDIIKKNFFLKIKTDIPNKKLEIFNPKEYISIEEINNLYLKRRNNENDDIKQNGKLIYDRNEKEINGSINGEEGKIKEIINSRKDKKKLTWEATNSNSKNKNRAGKIKKNSIDNNIILKKEISIQTEKEKYYICGQESFNYSPDFNKDDYLNINNYYSQFNNGNNTYNGNYPIDISQFKTYNGNTYNPNTINCDSIIEKNNNGSQDLENKDINEIRFNKTASEFYNTNKDNNRIKKRLKNYYYQNELKSINVDSDTLKINKSRYTNQNTKYNNAEFTSDNKKLSKYQTNKQLQIIKSHYKKYEDMSNNIFSGEEPNFGKTLSKKKAGYNSVKNIKDEVIVKRNEIIEKIQHCQNLLNTIKIEKMLFTSNSKNIDNRNNNNLKKSPKNKVKKKHYIENDLNKKIKQVYIGYKKPMKMTKNFTYKRINIKLNDKQNTHSFDNINKDKNNNVISLPENYDKDKNFTMRTCLKKDIDTKEINNYESKAGLPGKKLVELYQKYEDNNFSSNVNNNNKKMTYNQTVSYKFNNKNYKK